MKRYIIIKIVLLMSLVYLDFYFPLTKLDLIGLMTIFAVALVADYGIYKLNQPIPTIDDTEPRGYRTVYPPKTVENKRQNNQSVTNKLNILRKQELLRRQSEDK